MNQIETYEQELSKRTIGSYFVENFSLREFIDSLKHFKNPVIDNHITYRKVREDAKI